MKSIKGNLLLIEDEVELSQSMKELLAEEAQQIFIASNGEEALKILGHNQIDCVVSDIKMPVMDGLTFMRKAREEGHHQPIIFFTGHGTDQLKREVRKMGAADLLMKPNFLMLELAIRKHMTSSDNHSIDPG